MADQTTEVNVKTTPLILSVVPFLAISIDTGEAGKPLQLLACHTQSNSQCAWAQMQPTYRPPDEGEQERQIPNVPRLVAAQTAQAGWVPHSEDWQPVQEAMTPLQPRRLIAAIAAASD